MILQCEFGSIDMSKTQYKILCFIFIGCFLINSLASATEADDKNKDYLDKVISKFTDECKDKSGINYLNCWAEYTPKRCKGLVYGKDRSAWARCVYSCGSASFYTKTFGECSN